MTGLETTSCSMLICAHWLVRPLPTFIPPARAISKSTKVPDRPYKAWSGRSHPTRNKRSMGCQWLDLVIHHSHSCLEAFDQCSRIGTVSSQLSDRFQVGKHAFQRGGVG